MHFETIFQHIFIIIFIKEILFHFLTKNGGPAFLNGISSIFCRRASALRFSLSSSGS
ncbi:hypothetical protein B4096_2174 [Heyndrickxia coagulans]|nr:hypothetical protein B4096_2174 [Heyndrickxia coagulans]